MHHDHSAPRPSSYEALSRAGLRRSNRRWLLLVAIAGLTTLTLACGVSGPGAWLVADRVVILTRLPTLTRTPLPPLLPTLTSTPVAVAMAAEGANNAPAPVSLADASAAPTSAQQATTNPDTAAVSVAPSPTEAAATSLSVQAPARTAPPLSTPAVTATQPLPPTPTATMIATGTPPPTRTPIPTPTRTPSPTRTSTPTATPTATPIREGWVFSGVRSAPDQDGDNLVLYGELLNDTGTAQALDTITGEFYDTRGKVIADGDTSDEVPLEVIPQGGQVPFKLTVVGIQSAANFDLKVKAKPSSETVRQDFGFVDLNPSIQAGTYCFSGQLRNPGDGLQSYLTIALVLYDKQDKVINFSQDDQPALTDQTTDFEVCVDSLKQSVARFDLQAWGH